MSVSVHLDEMVLPYDMPRMYYVAGHFLIIVTYEDNTECCKEIYSTDLIKLMNLDLNVTYREVTTNSDHALLLQYKA